MELDAYQIGRYPVAVAEFQQFMDDGGYRNPQWWTAGGFGEYGEPGTWEDQLLHPNWPLTGVSWYEAAAYCAWADGRLPTEAEWERAGRGSADRRYPWGKDQPDSTRANYCPGRVGHATPVGLYPASATPEGLQDMAGNVWDWVEDWYAEGYYGESARRSPRGPASGDLRVVRGGSWYNSPGNLRAAVRYGYRPDIRDGNVGFRCAREIGSP